MLHYKTSRYVSLVQVDMVAYRKEEKLNFRNYKAVLFNCSIWVTGKDRINGQNSLLTFC